jgi:uncharacterized membrane protein YeaQ/YmgE (transglycosylase-associated protein family)
MTGMGNSRPNTHGIGSALGVENGGRLRGITPRLSGDETQQAVEQDGEDRLIGGAGCGAWSRARTQSMLYDLLEPGHVTSNGLCVMSIIGWIILGLIAGFIASKIVNKTGQGFFLDIVLGVVGAIVGGFIFSALGGSGITGFNVYSIIVAIIGAIIVLVIYHAIVGRRVT